MKKQLFGLLALLIATSLSLTAWGQERTTKSKGVIGTVVVSELRSAKGWMLDPDGEWMSAKNKIPISVPSEKKYLLKRGWRKIGVDNFRSYQMRELKHEGKSYCVLIKLYMDGYYNLPNIEEDWYNRFSHIAYIFEKEELEKLKNIKDGQVNMVKISLVAEVDLKYIEFNALKLIPKKIDWEKVPETELVLHIAPYKEKDIVRFQIYTINKNSRFIGGINNEHMVKGKQIYSSDELFKYCYYETDYLNFNNFLNIR